MAETAKKTKKTPATRTTPPAKKKGWGRVAKGGGEQACSIEGCQRPYRAKSYCFFHYKKWRQGELPHSRYKTCSKPDCRQEAIRHGLCEKHDAETYRTDEAA